MLWNIFEEIDWEKKKVLSREMQTVQFEDKARNIAIAYENDENSCNDWEDQDSIAQTHEVWGIVDAALKRWGKIQAAEPGEDQPQRWNEETERVQ